MSGIDLDAIDKAIDKAELEMEENSVLAQRKLFLQIDQLLVLATPVKEGRARANWIPSINFSSSDITDETDPSGSKAIAEGVAVASKIKFADDVYITNNLPYIGRLNDGYSAKAPAGFVEKAVQVAKTALS